MWTAKITNQEDNATSKAITFEFTDGTTVILLIGV